MEAERQTQLPNNNSSSSSSAEQSDKLIKKWLLYLNCACLAVGSTGGPLLLRLYFLHGGKRKWLSSWLETAGFPAMLFPLSVSYFLRCRQAQHRGVSTEMLLITPRLYTASAFIGLLTGLDDYMYAYGLSYIPVSTSSILISSQLAFTALFALILVKQKFTPYSINSVALLTLGAVVLGLHTNGDRPPHVSNAQYYSGFFITLAAALLYGLVLPLIELTYAKAGQTVTYTLVMEIQFVICFFATSFCTVGMLVDKDFEVIPREAREFGLGGVRYYVVLVISGLVWQLFFIGAVGVIFCASSLVSGIVIAVTIPVTEVLAVLFYKEKFSGEKGMSLALSLWGFASYFYGEYKSNRKKKQPTTETEMSGLSVVST